MIFKRDNLNNFQKYVHSYSNTGHSAIELGFKSCRISAKNEVLSVWDANIGTKNCSCRSKIKPEILLATSLIVSDSTITNSSDFSEMNTRITHLNAFHKFSSVIGLGINSTTGNDVDINQLDVSQQNFLKNLMRDHTSIGCRGQETKRFFLGNGFQESNLFVTGCPSLQLIDTNLKEVPKNISRILVSGALINRLDLIESLEPDEIKILVIPQTIDSYMNVLRVQKLYSGIEIFTPSSYRSWVNKLKSWRPDVSIGTRLHGNITALSVGIPAIMMSGDVRTREIATVSGLPFLSDIAPIRSAITQFEFADMQEVEQKKYTLRTQLIECVNS